MTREWICEDNLQVIIQSLWVPLIRHRTRF